MEPAVREQLNELQRRAHRATLNGNATTELCRVVADLVGLIADQQDRIERLMNTPAPFTVPPFNAEAREAFRAEHGTGEGEW